MPRKLRLAPSLVEAAAVDPPPTTATACSEPPAPPSPRLEPSAPKARRRATSGECSSALAGAGSTGAVWGGGPSSAGTTESALTGGAPGEKAGGGEAVVCPLGSHGALTGSPPVVAPEAGEAPKHEPVLAWLSVAGPASDGGGAGSPSNDSCDPS